jgi:hypothetical protein
VFISGFACGTKYFVTDIEEPHTQGSHSPEPPSTEGLSFGPPIKPPELRIGAIEIGITIVRVPLGTLAMGWLTAWIIQGFRSN